jgi:hypothetical protein
MHEHDPVAAAGGHPKAVLAERRVASGATARTRIRVAPAPSLPSLAICFALLSLAPTSSANNNGQQGSAVASPTVGAIRWDAWYNVSTSPDDPGYAIEQALSLPEFHDRAPWFSSILPNGTVTANGATAEVIDSEIQMAALAGLNYFAFDMYPDGTMLAAARQLYMNSSSPHKAPAGPLYFALLLQTGWMNQVGLSGWPAAAAYYASIFARPDYMRVPDGSGGAPRPIAHLFSVYEDAWGGSGGWADWAWVLETLANATLAAGAPRPYLVLQTFSVAQGWEMIQSINNASAAAAAAAAAAATPAAPPQRLIDGISSYAVVGGAGFPDPGPYSALAQANEDFWAECASTTGADVVPPITAGWDPRPMNFSHLPWANYTDPRFVEQPTPAELAGLVQAAVTWLEAHPSAAPAQTALLSAFNEYAEGHWVAPVLPQYGGDERLQAIGAVLGGRRGRGRV